MIYCAFMGGSAIQSELHYWWQHLKHIYINCMVWFCYCSSYVLCTAKAAAPQNCPRALLRSLVNFFLLGWKFGR